MKCQNEDCEYVFDTSVSVKPVEPGVFTLVCPGCETEITLFTKEYAEGLLNQALASRIHLRTLGEVFREHFSPPDFPAGYVMAAEAREGLSIQIGTREVTINQDGYLADRDVFTLPAPAGDVSKARLVRLIQDSGGGEASAVLEEYEAALEGLQEGGGCSPAQNRFNVAMGKMMALAIRLSQQPEPEDGRSAKLEAVARGAHDLAMSYSGWVDVEQSERLWDENEDAYREIFVHRAARVLDGATPEDLYREDFGDASWAEAKPFVKVWYALFVRGVQMMAEAVGRL